MKGRQRTYVITVFEFAETYGTPVQLIIIIIIIIIITIMKSINKHNQTQQIIFLTS